MNHLHVHLTNYLKLRRGLGFKLHSAEMSLRSFIRFAEAKRVRFVTTKLALQWATQPPNAKRVQSGSRLATVRRFAEYLSTVDPRTEVPSPKLLPYHIRSGESRPSLSGTVASGWVMTPSIAGSCWCHVKPACASPATNAARACMTCGITSRSRPCFSGIAPTRMSRRVCRS
jgi:hypothetical protein